MRHGLTLGFLLLLVFGPCIATRAAEEKSEKEKRREAEAAAEERLDQEDSARNPLLRGKVVLFSTPNPDDPSIIGLFIAGGHRYKLEVTREELKAELRKYGKKELALSGKIRDQGTTFIADAIEGGGPPPGLVRNPDGL